MLYTFITLKVFNSSNCTKNYHTRQGLTKELKSFASHNPQKNIKGQSLQAPATAPSNFLNIP